MRVTRITANLPVDDVDAARSFYTDFLGLDVGFDLGWDCSIFGVFGLTRRAEVRRDGHGV